MSQFGGKRNLAPQLLGLHFKQRLKNKLVKTTMYDEQTQTAKSKDESQKNIAFYKYIQ